MILVDANLLIYAHITSFPSHAVARSWLDTQLNGTVAVGLPWASLLAFLRVVTNPRVLPNPSPIEHAWTEVRGWLECDCVWIPQPSERHVEVLGSLMSDRDMRGDLIPDAHLAALAIEHGLTLCSADKDFARFPGLRWVNPLAS